MRKRSCLLTGLAAICLLAVLPGPAAAYIKYPPTTLGDMCRQSIHIYILQVEKFSAEKGVILFRPVQQLKALEALPEGALAKHVIASDANGAKVILDWAAEGKTAIMFAKIRDVKAHVYIDGYWYSVLYDGKSKCWLSANGEPTLLTRYCGTLEQLGDAVTIILRGEEVVVPAMVGDNPRDLEQRRAKTQELRASLKILGAADVRKPDRVGTIKALAEGKSFRLLPLATEKGKEPAAIDIQISERTRIIAGPEGQEPGKLAVGQTVSVVLAGKSANVAAEVRIGQPPDKPEKEPAPEDKGKKPGDKKPEPGDKKPDNKGKEPAPNATEKKPEELKKTDAKKLAPADKGGKSAPDAPVQKPEEPRKPREPARPARDPAPTAAVIDAEVDKHLARIKVPASPVADDAEFLRRVTLDLTGRIPTYQQTVAFLDSKDPDKRRKLIDELLDSPEYGEHLGTVWRNHLVGREINPTGKGGANTDTFRLWLAEQFNTNRGWNAIVTDLLTAEGTPRDNPATAFLLTNGENGQPRPNKVAGAAAALFWGVNLRCAECHNHPFAHWKQNDFWGTAAFFGKVQYSGSKSGGSPSLTEALGGTISSKEKGQTVPAVRGTGIVIPGGSGKAAGQVVKARFLGADEPALDENAPFRPRFAEWATAADNPYFARAAVNRMWAHFFGRGFVNPLDAFDTSSPSHLELLDRLAKEFAASGFDLKHLARCITTSKAYQRTSNPVPGNEADTVAFSHMAVKVLTSEVLYDALATIGRGNEDLGKGGGKGSGDRQESRDQFLRSFRIDEEATATDYIQGIPQLLRLMNASSLNRGASVVEKLCSSKASYPEAITTLYLTALSRRPTPAEVELMSGYLSRRKDDREGYRGVLWILLNSSEFALNR